MTHRRYRTIPEIRREMVKALANQMREKQGKEPIVWSDEKNASEAHPQESKASQPMEVTGAP